MLCSCQTPSPIPQHNNSQHALAIINHSHNSREDLERDIIDEFGKTSELPCDVWHDETESILLASNYPNCLLESKAWCVLCAGFAYQYRKAFGSINKTSNTTDNASFARTILNFLERCEFQQKSLSNIEDRISQCLKRCLGYFSVYLVRKGTTSDNNPSLFWAWNDPFGFMPVYICQNRNVCIVSSHWDCITPNISSLELDWGIVAEYITFGTTLGGGGEGTEFDNTFDKTLIRGIKNIGPGCFLHLIPSDEELQLRLTRYVECYGACEDLANLEEIKSKRDTKSSLSMKESSGIYHEAHSPVIRGVKLRGKSNKPGPIFSSVDGDMLALLFQFIMESIEEAQMYVTGAALTGGGDTRLILACLLLLNQHFRPEANTFDCNSITFQTHSKQRTDWQIANHLAVMFQLKHRRINPMSTTTNGHVTSLRRGEVLLSNLHDQTPLRRKGNRRCLCRHSKNDSSPVEYTLHGRFGTEFLGCLCFYKSPLDIRDLEEVENYQTKGTSLFQVAFGSSSSIRNPMVTLHDRFQQLKRDQMAYTKKSKMCELAPLETNNLDTLDIAYAFQLQLYTRAGLSDIYKGLRGGSWFSIPTAQFTRNAITPFLDNRLLQWMMCRVSARQKEEPYQLYGQLYQSGVVPEVLLKVPSNNKLLCIHSEIPHALKSPEAKVQPHIPKFAKKKIRNSKAFDVLEQKFNPVFWKGAIAIFKGAPIAMDPKSIINDARPEVRALLNELDGNAQDACLLSGRLQSFLLWYERRFETKINRCVD